MAFQRDSISDRLLPANDGYMVHDLWPADLTEQIKHLQPDQGLLAWQKFPSTLPKLIEWAEVYRDVEQKDKSCDRILIYKHMPNARANTLYPVALRVHGFLGRFCFERLGNWSGWDTETMEQKCHWLNIFRKPQDAHKAIQHIALSSGGHSEPWNTTMRAINVACDYASRQLRIPMKGVRFGNDIYFQRRVFSKVGEAFIQNDEGDWRPGSVQEQGKMRIHQ